MKTRKKDNFDTVDFIKPYQKSRYQEAFEPISLELPLPSEEQYYYDAPQKSKSEKDKSNEVERGVWTVDI